MLASDLTVTRTLTITVETVAWFKAAIGEPGPWHPSPAGRRRPADQVALAPGKPPLKPLRAAICLIDWIKVFAQTRGDNSVFRR